MKILTLVAVVIILGSFFSPAYAQSVNAQAEPSFAFDTAAPAKEEQKQEPQPLPNVDPNSPMANPIFAKLPSDIQAEILNETEIIHKDCEKDSFFAQLIDCNCLAGTFFETRLREPEKPKEIISFEIQNTCANTAGMAGYAYNQCLMFGTYTYLHKDTEALCTCYANKMAEMYTKNPGSDHGWLRYLGSEALGACQREMVTGAPSRGGPSGYRQ